MKIWLAAFQRQGRLAGLVFAIGLVITSLVIVFFPRKYESQAKLLVRMGHENVSLDPTVSSAGDPAAVYRTSQGEMLTTIDMMRSESVLEEVITRVGADAILSGTVPDGGEPSTGLLQSIKSTLGGILASIDPIDDKERALVQLGKELRLDAESTSNVVAIRYRAKTPELARLVTTTWIDAYREHHSEMNSTLGSLEFLQTQGDLLAAKLATAREQLRDRKNQYGIVTVPGRQTTLENQLEWAETSLLKNETRRAGLIAKLDALKQQRTQTSERITTTEMRSDTNDTLSTMRGRLYDLEIEERRLAATYTSSNPKYKAVLSQLKDARDVVESQSDQSAETTEGLNPIYTRIVEDLNASLSEVDALDSEIIATRATIENLTVKLDELNQHEAELAVLEREVAVLEEEFRVHHGRREQARLAEELKTSEISNLNVIQPATLRLRPVTPDKKLCVLLGLLGSGACAVGLVLLREARNLDLIPTIVATE